MTSRLQQVQDFYRPKPQGILGLLSSTTESDRNKFRGTAVSHACVVRVDLNGYSKWARDKDIVARAALLNDFFSHCVPLIENRGGVYFRDEGDCIVALFSEYFGLTNAHFDALEFSKDAVRQTYGADAHTAKASIACGDVAFFQKQHEVSTDDWSAEGEPFVAAGRLEQAADSGQVVHLFAKQYSAHFAASAPMAPPGATYYWWLKAEARRVPGLQLDGRWADLSLLEYVPGGRVAGR